MTRIFDTDFVATQNDSHRAALDEEYDALGRKLERQGTDIARITAAAEAFTVAIPSWGVGVGGTRFARFAGPSEPRNIMEKLEDCAVINRLVTCTPSVSPHFPWDRVDDLTEVRDTAAAYDLSFASINSNTFQDQPAQALSYKFGSLTHSNPATREQAVAHNIDCIEYGKILGAKSLTVWIADGSNFPGQQHFSNALERYLESMRTIYAALPDDWRIHIEHKMFEPAFYSTVIQDWGTSVLCAMELGDKAFSLVDLGHHAPNVNIEMIVARLIQFRKLAGFHFNDSKYGDDDLDSGSIHPYQQFLVFNELVDAAYRGVEGFDPEYMLDQSHNITDPIESLMSSAMSVQRSYVQALLVDRPALDGYQQENDAIMASNLLKAAFETDVSPILGRARANAGGAIDPIACYRAGAYRDALASKRPALSGTSSGIV